MDRNEQLDRYRGSLVGLAAGDAVGTTLEFTPREYVEPIKDMVGGGPFNLEPGQWTDDTSMALCLAESLVEAGGFDPFDQMRRYCKWCSSGYLSSNGRCFDIGMTTSDALTRFQSTDEPYAGSTDPNAAGNGSIMRLAPVALFFSPDEDAVREHAALSSQTTHGAAECIDACEILATLIHRVLTGASKEQLREPVAGEWSSVGIASIAEHDYLTKSENEIRGTGYVVESLEAALWCFHTTDDFKSAILQAANLGNDADTTAAICGQVAGAYYGYASIPASWRDKLAMRDEIVRLADCLHDS